MYYIIVISQTNHWFIKNNLDPVGLSDHLIDIFDKPT